FYGGTEGRIGQRLGFHAMISVSKIEGMPYFVNDTSLVLKNRFSVVLDEETNIFAVKAGLSFQHSQKWQSLAEVNFAQYSPSEGTAWHVPGLTGSLALRYSLREKIILEAEAYAEGTRKAQAFNAIGEDMEIEMKGFIDAGLGIEYRYSKVLSAFLQFNNMLGKDYQQWYGYPVQGFRAMAGFSYSF
ncbi:MAG: hypothetical protein IH599_07495, partial [Bacteroidales bacterium]|nr:hypothetical protein [Bacteroidales bacterium]